MTTTKTADIAATVAQIKSLEELGCDIIRVAVPDMESADAISKIKDSINIPLVADIHFDYRLALRAIERGADKIRINPGNIGGYANVQAVADACKRKNIPIRIGVNSGSLSKDITDRFGGVTAEAMAESAIEHVRLLNRLNFDNIWISVKSTDVRLTVQACRLLHERTIYPLHIGVTEAGTEYNGIIKNALAIGSLLIDGIGKTIRVSLTADPEREVIAAKAMLKALGLRGGIEVISCPVCGRCNIDVIKIAAKVERALCEIEQSFIDENKTGDCNKKLTVAVMGCAVNGPGEASRADYGIAGGDREGVIFAKGRIIGKAANSKLASELLKIISNK